MANVTHVQQFGNQLAVLFDDGTKRLAKPTVGGLWIVGAASGGGGTDPGTGGGTGSLELVSPLPTTFTGTDAAGDSITLNSTQIQRMAQIIQYASTNPKVDRSVILIMGIAAMTESSLRNLANPETYPETASLPDIDGSGDDHDSVGLWQMRPESGWGTPTQCATISYEVSAFLGGPGPNGGSPAGLFDISGWETMTPGEAAQAVEVSAFPDRYDNYVPFITALMNAILKPDTGGGTGKALIYPTSTHDISDTFADHVARASVNPGTDYTAPNGSDVWAVADGTVTDVTLTIDGSGGRMIHIDHTAMGTGSDYLHLSVAGVTVGQVVKQGVKIGSSGGSAYGSETGDPYHLHISYRTVLGSAYMDDHNIDFDAKLKSL